MGINVLKLARNDLKEIYEYLSEFGDTPSEKFRRSFEKFCGTVRLLPEIFGEYRSNPDYRYHSIEFGYIVFYKINKDTNSIDVYRTLHSKRYIEMILR
ncbi:MAG: type II toxin-antitoxin system RelE/ParE family toxin [Clostridiales bacterium]|nr:type II toxin-antitoxin system RelE/ParE family toxin [Clostridiales bacterium]